MGKLKSLLWIVACNAAVLAGIVGAIFLVLDRWPNLIQVNGYYFPYLGLRADYDTDAKLVFRGRPQHKVFDSFGSQYRPEFADLGVTTPKITFDITIGPSGFREDGGNSTADILVLGDSFVQISEASGDTFSRRLQAVSGVSTLNRGLAWYGPDQYLETFRRFADSSRARIALFCIFEGNDLSDLQQYANWQAGGGYYDQYFLHPGITFWQRFRYFVQDFTGLPARLPVKRPPESYRRQLVELNLAGRLLPAAFSSMPDPRSAEQVLRSREGKDLNQVLAEFQALATAKGIRPLVVFIPSSPHVYGTLATERSGADWKVNAARTLLRVGNFEQVVTQLAARNHLELFDLEPPFRARAEAGTMLYYPFDSHWNAEGREAAAELVAARLQSLGWIPPARN